MFIIILVHKTLEKYLIHVYLGLQVDFTDMEHWPLKILRAR